MNNPDSISKSFLSRLIYTLLAISYLLFGSCVTSEYNVGTHSQDIMIISTEKEVAMGQNIAKKIVSEPGISANPYDQERVNKIGTKIADACDRKEISYYFYVIDKEDEINAFSIPGGYVYVYKDLLDLLNDDELAFVLAHEVGHIVSRHAVKRLQAAMGYNLLIIASAGSSDARFTKGLSFALEQLLAGYSREDEFNADELAVKYSETCGFNPKAGMQVLEKLYEEGKKKIRPLSYFRTHPFAAQRIRHIKESLHLPLSVDDYIN